MSVVIRVEDLSKQYRLGDVGTGSLRDDIKRWRYRMMGRENPFLKVGEENDRSIKSKSEYVWALKNINFEVKQGEILGIIGKNGAGKSTLLKILSRTIGPTIGSVKMKGRIASLLEVGTGFHGELSGRENIFLNGAVMGMTKTEIKKKLEEIIDFAGVEKYIDTPVKRYSSGMYVRLAFGVAAHLEPDIMIVDEVLAVGDAEFQKKALGKMKEVSDTKGRTVLFVSHNMQAVQKLCNSGILLKNGNVQDVGSIENIIQQYFTKEKVESLVVNIDPSTYSNQQLKNGFAKSVSFEDEEDNILNSIRVGTSWKVRIKFTIKIPMEHFVIGIGLTTANEIPVYTSWSRPSRVGVGDFEALFINDQILFATGGYKLSVGLSNYETAFHFIDDVTHFEILDIKEDSFKNDERVLRTSGTGLILNPITVTVNKL